MRDILCKVLEDSDDFPSLPGTVIKILEMISDPDLSLKDLAKVITTDAAMATRILKLVNSPFYGLNKRIDQIETALTYLGIDAITAMAISLSVTDSFEISESKEYGELFQFSLSAAITADIIAEINILSFKNKIFLASLLQNIGMYLLLRHLGKDYSNLMKQAKEQNIRLTLLEYDKYGIDHLELGQMIASKWNLPLYVSIAMQYRDHIDQLNDSNLSSEYKQIVKCAKLSYLASSAYNCWNRYFYFLKMRQYYKMFFPKSEVKIDDILASIPDLYKNFIKDYEIKIPLIPDFKKLKSEIQIEFLNSQDTYEKTAKELLKARKIITEQELTIKTFQKQLTSNKETIRKFITSDRK
jgi:HD-like signal output (HDOD) protein